jgi:hypothetical protein
MVLKSRLNDVADMAGAALDDEDDAPDDDELLVELLVELQAAKVSAATEVAATTDHRLTPVLPRANDTRFGSSIIVPLSSSHRHGGTASATVVLQHRIANDTRCT